MYLLKENREYYQISERLKPILLVAQRISILLMYVVRCVFHVNVKLLV